MKVSMQSREVHCTNPFPGPSSKPLPGVKQFFMCSHSSSDQAIFSPQTHTRTLLARAQLASVIGMDFDADLLLAVVTSHLVRDGLTPITREQLLRTLDDLDHLNFLNVRKAENGKTYHFSNSVRVSWADPSYKNIA